MGFEFGVIVWLAMTEKKFAIAFLVLGIGFIAFGAVFARYRVAYIALGVVFLAVAAIRSRRG